MPLKTITTVEHLLARFESSTYDLKKTYDLTALDRCEIAKDVSAFSNAFGGVIVVGLKEVDGKIVDVPGVPDVAKLTDAIAAALRDHCVPVLLPPEEHSILVSPEDAARLLAADGERSPPTNTVTLVALNIRPDPRGPIGIRPFPLGKQPKGMGDLYRFAVRLDNQTRFLNPTELPMWMNSHERRIAIQLRELLDDAVPGVVVRVFHLPPGQDMSRPSDERMKLAGVDEGRLIVQFSDRAKGDAGPVHVPLSYVSAVWQDARSRDWTISVRGALYADRSGNASFTPLGGA